MLREETINNNYKLLKNNNNLYNYYFKQIIRSDKDYIIRNTKKAIFNYSENIIKKKKNLSKKYKYKFISIYKNYIYMKNIIKNLLKKNYIVKNKFSLYKSKFNLLGNLKNKFFKLNNNLQKYNKFNDKITFDFKNLMIFNKYNWLYNIVYTEEKKYNLFSTYYYNKNDYIPFIYNHFYEEPFIDGAIKFEINEKNYNW